MTEAGERQAAAKHGTNVRLARNRMFNVHGFARILLLAAAIGSAILSARAERPSKGWWVILRAFPTEPAQWQRTDFERVDAERLFVATCRINSADFDLDITCLW
jgi:hypothetical protein